MKILLFNQYAGNKGDRAVLFATCRMIRNIHPEAVITVSTSSPELYDSYPYYKDNDIKFIPSAWDYKRVNGSKWYWTRLDKVKKYTFTILRETYLRNFCKWVTRFLINPQFRKAVQEADHIISVGGHHYCTLLSVDLVSGINFDAMSVLHQNKTFTCFSQTFGPFKYNNARNRQITLTILNSCKLFPRELESQERLLEFGINQENISMTYETVIGLNSLFQKYKLPSTRVKRVGIAIYCAQKRNKEDDTNYINSLSTLCSYVILKGYEVIFFPMEIKGTLPDDRPYIQNIIKHIINPSKCKIIDEDLESTEHLKQVAECQIFIGHKTHSTIFALATGTPLLAIAYHPKTVEFMKQYGLERNVIDDKFISANQLKMMFDDIAADIDTIGLQQYNISNKYTQYIQKALSSILNN